MRLYLLFPLVLVACGSTPTPSPSGRASSAAPLASAAPTPATPTVDSSAPSLVPSRSIGPIALGMSRAEVDALGMPVRPHPSGQMGDDVRIVGTYHVVFRADRVDSIELDLRESPSGVRIGARTFPPPATATELVSALSGCEAEQINEGGNIIACEGRRTLIKQGASCVARERSGACREWDPQHPGLALQVLASPL